MDDLQNDKTEYAGHVANGVVVLDEAAHLPEGARVRVIPVIDLTLAERLKKIIGIAKGLPSDLAKNHNHYIHGTPKI